MYLIQIFLPLSDNTGIPFPESLMSKIRNELAQMFGGVTAFIHSPAEGVWAQGGGKMRDQIVLIEVLAESLDREWWGDYRRGLEVRLQQESVLIHATAIEKL